MPMITEEGFTKSSLL